jgi:hypothetical protein
MINLLGLVIVVESLPSKHEALSSNPILEKKDDQSCFCFPQPFSVGKAAHAVFAFLSPFLLVKLPSSAPLTAVPFPDPRGNDT